MSDETNETSEQQPVEEAPETQAEAPAETPAEAPVEEQPQAQEETAPAADSSPAEEAPAPAERERPAKEEKKDVIPGANLEPIAIEPDGPALSAEERARLEAEEEEKRNREAALAAAESDSAAVDRAPAKMESGARFLATGKRKTSIARVIVMPGDGKITINGREIEEFFPRPLHQST